jgi:hypothetical protein
MLGTHFVQPRSSSHGSGAQAGGDAVAHTVGPAWPRPGVKMGSSSSHRVEGGRSATHAQDVKLYMLAVAVGGAHEQRLERIERATICPRRVQHPKLHFMGESEAPGAAQERRKTG